MEDLGIDYEESKLYSMNSFSNFGDAVKNDLFTAEHSYEDFIKAAIDNPSIENSLLDSEMAYYREYGTVLFPAIVINNQTFRGQFEVEAVMNAICAGFAKPPHMCKKMLESGINDPAILFYPDEEEYSAHHVFTVCFLIMVTVVIVMCLYRRHAKREMKKNINV